MIGLAIEGSFLQKHNCLLYLAKSGVTMFQGKRVLSGTWNLKELMLFQLLQTKLQINVNNTVVLPDTVSSGEVNASL